MQLATNQAAKSSSWVWVALLITLAITLWTAFNSDQVEEDAGELLNANAGINQGSIKTKQNEVALLNNESKVQFTAENPWRVSNRQAEAYKVKDIFKPHSWVILPPVVKTRSVALPPEVPKAPPVPFVYMGKLEQGKDETQIFLMQNQKLITTSLGQTIEGIWQLDAESESSLRFTYLPLGLSVDMRKNQLNPMSQNNPRRIDMNLE